MFSQEKFESVCRRLIPNFDYRMIDAFDRMKNENLLLSSADPDLFYDMEDALEVYGDEHDIDITSIDLDRYY